MASEREAFQPVQSLSGESAMARPVAVDSAAVVDGANGDGPVGEVHGVVDGGAPAALRIDADLKAPELFLNRELTWLAFNRRGLADALDEHNPLLEPGQGRAIY